MVNFHSQSQLQMLRLEWGDELELLNPTYSQLVELLAHIRDCGCINHCIECSVSLFGEVESQLFLTRVNNADDGQYVGWVAQLSSREDFVAFLLADTSCGSDSRRTSTVVELHGSHECIDTRCLLKHGTLLNWLQYELLGCKRTNRFRWIDFELALSAF